MDKCIFLKSCILGRTIFEEGIRPNMTKINVLTKSPIPTNMKEVRQFMSLASYYRRIIKNCASQTTCISNLIKKYIPLSWGSEQEIARSNIIKQLTLKPILTVFDPELPMELHTDASHIRYGVILLKNNISVE